MPLPTLSEQIAVEPILGQPDRFRSKVFANRLGNAAAIAYGGCTAAIAVSSAYQTIPNSNYHLYSVLGSFHGPTRIDRHINSQVRRPRTTKSFATRHVIVSQTQDDGTERTCMEVFCDFHALEPAMLTYSATPSPEYPTSGPLDPARTASNAQVAQSLLDKGHVTPEAVQATMTMFAMAEAFFEQRQCMAGVSGQNLMGLAKQLPTTQDARPLVERTSGEWLRARPGLSPTSDAEHGGALAFIMDGALSFLPLHLDHRSFEDGGACSTLDFALRIMVPGFRVDQWHLRERRTVAAAVGRTYSESRLWDEQGTLVAVETQTCILRPPLPQSLPVEKGAKAKI